jgi:L-threonylcarbamoyladenylate synthase
MLLDGRDPAAIARAAEAIAAGELVAFPTETVYGLGARADHDDAVAKIFALKGRPQDHPLIVHVADRAHAERFAAALPPVAERLIDAFWPGPLTVIVLRAAGSAMQRQRSGDDRAALPGAPDRACAARRGRRARRSRHRGAEREPLRPRQRDDRSARRRGARRRAARHRRRRGTHRHRVGDRRLLDRIAGAAEARHPDARPHRNRRRRGAAPAGSSGAARAGDARRALRAQGQGADHGDADAEGRARRPRQRPAELAVYSRSIPSGVATGVVHRRMPARPEQAAHELFAVLRELDREGVHLIWVEEPPPGPEWDGVRDRLDRAAAT